LALAEQLAIASGRPAAILHGRDLIAAGMAPGPLLGALLQRAYEAQIEGAFTTVEEGLAWLARDEPLPPDENQVS
jgi:tRNA nucleotidyltransferase (CCA-adding enzyme)